MTHVFVNTHVIIRLNNFLVKYTDVYNFVLYNDNTEFVYIEFKRYTDNTIERIRYPIKANQLMDVTGYPTWFVEMIMLIQYEIVNQTKLEGFGTQDEYILRSS